VGNFFFRGKAAEEPPGGRPRDRTQAAGVRGGSKEPLELSPLSDEVSKYMNTFYKTKFLRKTQHSLYR